MLQKQKSSLFQFYDAAKAVKNVHSSKPALEIKQFYNHGR